MINQLEKPLGADVMSALNSAEVTRRIDYTRPLIEYPTADKVAKLLSQHDKRKHVYTKGLNVNGVAVSDAMEKYLGTDAYQSSHFKQALITPLHLGFSLDDDKKELEKFKETKHFELGTFLHECILEPTKFSRAIVEPKHSLSTTDGTINLIEFWENQIRDQGYGFNEKDVKMSSEDAINLAYQSIVELGLSCEKLSGLKEYYRALKIFSGKRTVSEEHFLKIQILKKHYDNYGGGVLKNLLLKSKREISFYTERDGIKLKVRPDAIQFEENIGVNAIISIKSGSQEDLRSFYNQVAKLNYDLSEAMYQEVVSEVTGRDFNTTIMIFLQTVPPFGIAVLVWSPEDIETGKHKFRIA